MADSVNRIVPSSVGLDRAAWQGRERQKRKERESATGDMPPDTNGGEAPPQDSKKDKGKYLDVNA